MKFNKFGKLGFTIILLGLFSYFIWNLDANAILLSLAGIGINYLWIILVSFLAYLSATVAWKYCLNNNSISLSHLFRIRHLGEMLAMVNPSSVIAGDGLKYLLLKDYESDKTKILSSLFLSRLMLILSFIFIVLAGLIYFSQLLLSQLDKPVLLILSMLFLAMVVCSITYLFLSHKLLLPKIYHLLEHGPFSFLYRESFFQKLLSFNKSTAAFFKDHKRDGMYAFGFSLMHWLLGAFEYLLILKFLGVDISFEHAVLLESGVMVLKNLAAFIPGQLGVEELANKLLLSIVAPGNPNVWIALSLVRRSRQIFWLLLAVIIYLIQMKFKPNENLVYNT